MPPGSIKSFLALTEILRTPKRQLATFGATRIDYRLISPVEGLSARTRLRQGVVISQRPRILTAEAFAERFQGFGDEASEFAQWLSGAYHDLLRALEYNFHNQGMSARVINEPPRSVADRVIAEIDTHGATDQAVIRCPDGAWTLALMKFALDEAARSFPGHVRDLERRGMFEPDRGEGARRRREIEAMFPLAAADRSVADALGRKLREYGLFEEYEDRFLSLFR